MKNFRICEKSYKSQISKTYAPPESSKKCAEASPGTPIYIIKLRKDYQPNRPRTRSMNDGRCCRIWTDTFGDLRSRNIIDE